MLQSPLARQDAVGDPDRVYPLLQLYVAMLSNVVVVNVLDPSAIVGGVLQSTAVTLYNFVRNMVM